MTHVRKYTCAEVREAATRYVLIAAATFAASGKKDRTLRSATLSLTQRDGSIIGQSEYYEGIRSERCTEHRGDTGLREIELLIQP
jgi:hypothetical protein